MLLPNGVIERAIEIAEPFIQHWEAFKSEPYLCPTGHATIGFGCTEYANGTLVSMRDEPITLGTAIIMLENAMEMTINKIETFLEHVPTAHELAAMTSCAYNIGVYGFDHSTMMREFDLNNIQASADAFLLWDKGRDKQGNLVVIPGLRNRRLAERLLFLTIDTGNR